MIAEEHLSSGISTDLETARRDAERDLLTIESMFAQPILKVIEISKTSSEALDMLFALPWRSSRTQKRVSDSSRDYRNFYNFEIHMQDTVSQRTTRSGIQRGTGSGAEQQVSIYVAISASLASVYGTTQRRPGRTSGVSIAIFDEAFSKMDGKNQRQMMGFYKELGLQIVITAPLEKQVAVLEHMETTVEIDRIGERSGRRWFCSRSALEANSWA